MQAVGDIPVVSCNTAVLGAGCAGLNAADELMKAGVDVRLFCDEIGGGTSFNAGSDKQTYYKLSMSGGAPESVDAMARALFQGGGMHGDHARCMAALSARCFFKLVQLGVPFPHNEWGEYVGYQTDHDESLRATSAGPLTSRMMGEALLRSVRERGIPIHEGVRPVALLDGGLLLLRQGRLLLVNAAHVVLCTGSPSRVYQNTVYPDRQDGASGIAIRRGAATSNLCYWQYGLASVKVKWNVSGSYQQALPRYVDENGMPLIDGAFSSDSDRLRAIFLKGYQWPFDARKIRESSRVDLAVRAAQNAGRRAFLDYRSDAPEDILPLLDDEVRAYLTQCGALRQKPIERLLSINREAVRFYAGHGIDLAAEPLEISVCAQHCNGGLQIDPWWRTSLPSVYAAGECAGAFGITRPGGSALNETQVGSLRAAQHIIAHGGHDAPPSEEEFRRRVEKDVLRETLSLRNATEGQGGLWTAKALLHKTREAMDQCAGAVRSTEGMLTMRREVEGMLALLEAPPEEPQDAEDFVRLRDVLHTQRATLDAMLLQAEYAGEATHFIRDGAPLRKEDIRFLAFETQGDAVRAVPVRDVPEGGGWFEKVWRAYQDAEVFG